LGPLVGAVAPWDARFSLCFDFLSVGCELGEAFGDVCDLALHPRHLAQRLLSGKQFVLLGCERCQALLPSVQSRLCESCFCFSINNLLLRYLGKIKQTLWVSQ
jgi:hypothetical protein